MSKQSVKGNVYVFTKKKFMQDMCKDHSSAYVKLNFVGKWVNKVNGNVVTTLDGWEGRIKDFEVYAEWCKCIKNNNPKIESEEI